MLNLILKKTETVCYQKTRALFAYYEHDNEQDLSVASKEKRPMTSLGKR